MLVNKFRNKYTVNGTRELQVDKIIKDEIKIMFDEGTPSEAALNKLDKKLEQLIKKARTEPTPYNDYTDDVKSQGAKSNDSRGALRRSYHATATGSNEFQKTGLSVLKPQSTKDILNGGRVFYEDPAAALNVSEEKWNLIVQENLRKHKETEEKTKKDKFLRNKIIQEEQRRQVELRKAQEDALKKKEMDDFNNFGAYSSDVYYVNHDKKLKKEADLKGGSFQLAQLLK